MEALKALLDDLFGDDSPPATPDTPFADLETWDSLHYVRLVMGLQTRFQVDLSPEEIQSLTSIRAVEDVLRNRQVL